jgi:hypothetical protein
MCLLLAQFSSFLFLLFFTAAINSTNEANKQPVCAVKQSIYLDAYGYSTEASSRLASNYKTKVYMLF